MKNILLICLSLFFLLACSGTKSLTDTLYASNWVTFENETFSISYPKKLNLDEPLTITKNVTQLLMISGKGANGSKDFIAVNLVTEKVEGDYANLDTYSTVSLINISSIFKIKKFSQQEGEVNGLKYKQFNYQVKMFKLKMYFIQRLYVIDDIAYVLTFNCYKKYSQSHLKTAIKILNSFTIYE
jgi:hypothetical protein